MDGALEYCLVPVRNERPTDGYKRPTDRYGRSTDGYDRPTDGYCIQDYTPPGKNTWLKLIFSKTWDTHTQNEKWSRWKDVVEIFRQTYRLACTLSPLSRNPSLKFVRGGLLSYHPCDIIYTRYLARDNYPLDPPTRVGTGPHGH